MSQALRIPARGDGYALSAGLFLPEGPPKAAVLLAGAMAVPARFHAPLARYIAEESAAALTLDYRGIGGSRPEGSLRGFHATFHDWGERDLGGAVDWLADRFPGLPLLWSRWGRDPRYVYSYAEPRGGLGYTRYAGPLLGTSIMETVRWLLAHRIS